MWMLGEEITLPSGKRVPLTDAPDVDRQWSPMELAGLWHVVRKGQSDRPSFSFYFGGEALPLQLDAEDAAELAEALNGVIELE